MTPASHPGPGRQKTADRTHRSLDEFVEMVVTGWILKGSRLWNTSIGLNFWERSGRNYFMGKGRGISTSGETLTTETSCIYLYSDR